MKRLKSIESTGFNTMAASAMSISGPRVAKAQSGQLSGIGKCFDLEGVFQGGDWRNSRQRKVEMTRAIHQDNSN